MAIAAVLMGLAAPGYRNYQLRVASYAVSDMVVSALRLARGEAASRGVPVSVCALGADLRTCDDGAAGDWSRGLAVVADLGRPARRGSGSSRARTRSSGSACSIAARG